MGFPSSDKEEESTLARYNAAVADGAPLPLHTGLPSSQISLQTIGSVAL